MKIFQNISLKPYNTFGIDVKTKFLVDCDSESDIINVCKTFADEQKLIIGGGSNVLFLNDYDGVVIRPLIKEYEILEKSATDVIISVGAGVVWDDFVAMCVNNNWFGAENLSAIPGNVGASPVQNIGAYGAEVANIIHSVDGVLINSNEKFHIDAEHCNFGYRNSIFKNELRGNAIITRVTYHLTLSSSFKLDYGSVNERILQLGDVSLQNVRKAITQIRTEKLPNPTIEGNAGSFFKNPEVEASVAKDLLSQYPDMPNYALKDGRYKIPAGWLIEQSGWKGRTLGRAGVHNRQALVLVNKGGASGTDVMAVANAVVDAVKSKFGITISMEVNLIK